MSAVATLADGRPEPSPPDQAVRAELERIVNSPDFAASERSRKFLRYVVEETLAGRAERIKAFSVAVEVFDRDETFDAQNDPVVRIEAGRLRRALERYYLLAGQSDPVVIDIPKGAYVATFALRRPDGPPAETPAMPAAVADSARASPSQARHQIWPYAAAALVLAVLALAAWLLIDRGSFSPVSAGAVGRGPNVLVLPFNDLGEGPTSTLYAAALTDDVVTGLARFKELTVFGIQTSRAIGREEYPAKAYQALGAEYVLEGSVRTEGDRVRVTSRLLNAANGAVLWARSYEDDLTSRDLFAIQTGVADEVATALAQPYGIIFRAETSTKPDLPPDDLEAYLCTLSAYAYRAALGAEKHAAARECLERAVVRFPTYSTAWAMLAYLYVDEVRFGFNPRPGDPTAVARALDAARKAVKIEPENARALQALMTALFFDHQIAEAFAVGEKARTINPNDTELIGQLGSYIAQSGKWREGSILIEEALSKNPGQAGYYHGVLALAAFMQKDFDRALAEIEQADQRSLPIFHGIAAMIYGEVGNTQKAVEEAAIFTKMAPTFIANFDAEMNKRNIRPEDGKRFVESLAKAGITVPPSEIAKSDSSINTQ